MVGNTRRQIMIRNTINAPSRVGHIKAGIGYRCDRKSVLGNPFDMRAERDRPLVCKAFRHYLYRVAVMRQCPNEAAHAIAKELSLVIARAWINPPRADFMAALQYLEDRPATRLLCWCHPKQCHCESIERYLVWRGDRKRGLLVICSSQNEQFG